MDVIKFNNSISTPTKMENAEIVSGIDSKTWIERYQEAGEFTFKGKASSGLRDSLPIGSFVSHINTSELMIVENHEVSDSIDGASEITITGRSLETFLENRAVGPNYKTNAAYTVWEQCVDLIQNYIDPSRVENSDYGISYVTVANSITSDQSTILGPGTHKRKLQNGSVYARLLELLAVKNLGIKSIRPGDSTDASKTNVKLLIHYGIDRTYPSSLSDTVMFSYDNGDILSSEYLWSIKSLKNSASVMGKWVNVALDYTNTNNTPIISGYDRRIMYVDGSDIDNSFNAYPTGTDLTDVQDAMAQRAQDAIDSQVTTALTKVEVSKQSTQAVYRTDFNVGDIVVVSGHYNQFASMRVTEYAEIEDETGETGYPTLTLA